MAEISEEVFYKLFGKVDLGDVPDTYTPKEDIEPIISLSRAFKPRVVVEIGIQKGATAKYMLDNGPWIEKYIGIDVPHTYVPKLVHQNAEIPTIPGEVVLNDPRVELMIKTNGSRDLMPSDFPKCDLVYIDGDHSISGVTYDTQLARQIINNSGVICWHDYGNEQGVMLVVERLNNREGDRIFHIKNTRLCFEIT